MAIVFFRTVVVVLAFVANFLAGLVAFRRTGFLTVVVGFPILATEDVVVAATIDLATATASARATTGVTVAAGPEVVVVVVARAVGVTVVGALDATEPWAEASAGGAVKEFATVVVVVVDTVVVVAAALELDVGAVVVVVDVATDEEVLDSGDRERTILTIGAWPGTTPLTESCWATTGPATTLPLTLIASPPTAGSLVTVTSILHVVVAVNAGKRKSWVGTSGMSRAVSVSVGGKMLTGAQVIVTATSISPSIWSRRSSVTRTAFVVMTVAARPAVLVVCRMAATRTVGPSSAAKAERRRMVPTLVPCPQTLARSCHLWFRGRGGPGPEASPRN